MDALEIYVFSVGQADTAFIKTPNGKGIVIDAVKPDKTVEFIESVMNPGDKITHLVVTHPHSDHYTGVAGLVNTFPDIEQAILAPFWHYEGTAGYHAAVNAINEKGIPIRFLSGYERIFPEPDPQLTRIIDNNFFLELLGPPNDVLDDLYTSGDLNPNHLSIMARLNYGDFRMVFTGDAQMENWFHFDRAGMLKENCSVLKAAHHGSKNGNQWERIFRLKPSLVIVSSDPDSNHHLPDMVGAAIFHEYERTEGKKVVLSRDTGTIKITARPTGSYTAKCFGEGVYSDVNVNNEQDLVRTNW